MRLWTVHPRYLDAKGLVAVWREGLLAQKVLLGATRGYKHHPQLVRFRSHAQPIDAIAAYLWIIAEEAIRRGYRFDTSKIPLRRTAEHIRETQGQLLFEWKHLRAKLRARAPQTYRELRSLKRPDPHPLFKIIPGEIKDWEKTLMRRTSKDRQFTKRISDMKLTLALVLLIAPFSIAENPRVVLTPVRGHLYVVEDYFYLRENSIVYLGDDSVTVVGATWTPETAKLLVNEINKITSKPISEVIDTNYHPDRAGGNAYFKSIGAKIVSTKMTSDLLTQHWNEMVRYVQKGFPNYPTLPLVAPDKTFAGDFELQNGSVKGIYLGPSHTPDGIFVFFPQEKVLYGNCILKEQLGNLDFADLTEYPKTLEKLKHLNLGFTTIVAGHWSAIHGPELIDQYLQLLAAKSR